MSDGGQYNYDFGYGPDSEQGQGEVSSGNETAGTDWSSILGGDNIFSRFMSGTSSGQDKALATLGFGIASLVSALRNKPPEVKMPVYKEAPVYNRALTAPMLPPQPAPTKSASGQNIYQPMRGLPLFFNPNPFQFNPTEAAKRYGPTPEEQAAGMVGYQQGLERLYQTLGTQPAIQFGTGASTVTGATGNDTVAGGQSTVTGGGGQDTVAGASGGSLDDLMMAAGRYLKGPGDGMSDSIPATINNKQPARLADGEFVVPADVVSDLGNGSSNAGAKKLYDMMKRIRQARHGTKKQPPEVKADKAMPR